MNFACPGPRWFNRLALLALLALSPVSTVRAADITVDDDCQLADAIAAANEDAPHGGCPAGDGADVILLTGDVVLKGMLPPVSSRISLQGNGHWLRGDKRDRLLRVRSGHLNIHNLTLTGGQREPDSGGAIRVDSGASLRVVDSLFHDNMAQWGGAIASYGPLEIENTTFRDNRAVSSGGAIFGADGALTVTGSDFESNIASLGGAISFFDGTGSIRGSDFRGNEASDDGGAVSSHAATLTISSSIFEGNRAKDNGGAINVTRSSLTVTKTSLLNNTAGSEGGGLKSWRDRIHISDSVISGNTARRDGGGIHSQAEDLTIRYTTISGNTGGSGGGLYATGGSHRIDGSAFSGNRAWRGGAVYSIGEEFRAGNSTFYRNRAVDRAGGLYLESASYLAHITVALNAAAEVGGLYIADEEARLVNSILAGNEGKDCLAPLSESVNNLIADGSCTATMEGDPLFAGLWGAPAVIVPANDSPAVDAGDPSHCLASDQLGRHRVWGKSCDLGAFEVDPSQELPLVNLATADSAASTEPQQDPVAGILVDGECSLADAISSANRGWAVGACPSGKPGADTITLTVDVTLQEDLPYVSSDVTIEGMGHTLSGAEKFAIFRVGANTLTLKDLTISEGYTYGGGAISSRDSKIIVERSKIISNRSVGDILADGGGIYCFPCTLIIRDSLIADNSTEQSGGGIAWYGLSEEYHLEIHNSVITGNSARIGGGLTISGPDSLQQATIVNTTVSNNVAESDGGGIEASIGAERSYLDISNSAIIGNRAGRSGGGIFVQGGARLRNVTIAGNKAESGGAVFTGDEGNTRLSHATVANNHAESGGGVYSRDDAALQLRFSIVAGNSGNDCVGYPAENILSHIGDGTCSAAIEGDPRLAPLVQPEDGSPAYFPLAPESRLIDAALDAYCGGQDQIGTPRPQGALCDLGAIEYLQNAEG